MNGKDIFLGLRYVDAAFIEEAEFGSFPAEERKPKLLRRPLLIAAVIALMLLLVGCGIVYVLKMQDLKIGEEMAIQQVFNERQEYVGEETVSQQVLTLSGLKGSPNYLAAQEWFEFKKNYDPEHTLLESIKHNIPQFPAQYDFYGPYSQEMVDKLDEIVQKYGLELMGERITGKTGKSLFAYLGTDDFLLPGVPASTDEYNGWYYAGGYCYADMKIRMAEGEGAWPYHTLLSYYYSPKNCFDNTVIALEDNGDWAERNYTTASGMDLLILRSPTSWLSWIFCDRGDVMITLRMETTMEVYTDEKGYAEVLKTPMTDDQLDQILDCVDFSLRPDPGDLALLSGLPEGHDGEAMRQTQDGVTMEYRSMKTDGHRIYITLRLTAPEGEVLIPTGEYDPNAPSLIFESFIMEPEVRVDFLFTNNTYYLQDDGDGQDNTAKLIVECLWRSENGVPFADGANWNLYLEDLCWQRWDKERLDWEKTPVAKGVWSFDLTVQGGDYREIEFVDRPVTTSVVRGWYADGSDAFADAVITSLKLRAYGGRAVFQNGNGGELTSPMNQKYPELVLKDGSKVKLDGLYYADSEDRGKALPLDDIDHLILMDGTKLYPVA